MQYFVVVGGGIEQLNNISLIKEIILATGTVKNNLIYRKNVKIKKKLNQINI